VSISRRELLSWLLGAPLAAQACRRSRREFAGSIRGGAMSSGHRLVSRAPPSLERASGPVQRTGIAIVGAGISGLSAAWRLERLGERDYTIFELEGKPGVTSGYGTDGVVPYPWGAHYVPVPGRDNRALGALLQEIGAVEQQPDGDFRGREGVLVREADERIFVNGSWHGGLFPTLLASDGDRAQLRRFEEETRRWAAFRDAQGRRAFSLPMHASSNAAELTALDRISAAEWLKQRGFSSKLLEWHVDYACRDDYGLTLSATSAWAMLFYFASRVHEPGRSSAAFLTWPEGNGRLVAHLAASAGARLRVGQLVSDVVQDESGVDLAVLDVATQKLRRYRADAVVLAAPQFVAAKLLRSWREKPPDHLGRFSYGSWFVANLHLSRRPRSAGHELSWDNVLYDSPSLGYVVATHQRLLDRGPTIFTYYQPLAGADPREARQRLSELEHRDFCDAILADLGRAHADLEDCVERIDVWRWGHAMVRPVPGFIWSAARQRAAQRVGRIHFAHSDLSGLALFEEAQDRGVRAAEAILAARGRQFASLLG
jgi:protoporphyrinogen oxidase